MTKDKWIWMPHAGHLIVGHDCRFHLHTYVGRYVVSTVGEWWPERMVREIHAQVHDPEWLANNKSRLGDDFDHAYMKRFGYEEIGIDRTYETMVFKAKKQKGGCCPYWQESGDCLDMDGYKTAEEAVKGHMKMCKKWSDREEKHE